jgi:hypothetical protein
MSDNKYNGWTNYATWRVNLEMFDDIEMGEFDGTDDAYPDYQYIGEQMKEWALGIIYDSCPQGLARDYACAFLDDVYWSEIAKVHHEEDVAQNIMLDE